MPLRCWELGGLSFSQILAQRGEQRPLLTCKDWAFGGCYNYNQLWHFTCYKLTCLLWSLLNRCYLNILCRFQSYFNSVPTLLSLLHAQNSVYIYKIQLHWSVKLLKIFSLYFCQLNKGLCEWKNPGCLFLLRFGKYPNFSGNGVCIFQAPTISVNTTAMVAAVMREISLNTNLHLSSTSSLI